MTSAISSGLQGYERAEATVNNAAARIAARPSGQLATAQPGSATPVDSADLSSTAVSLIEGKNNAMANLSTIRVADQMQKAALDILA